MPRFLLPLSTSPMEARTASEIPSEGGPWQYEPKWDGFRCLVFKEGQEVELRAKSGKSLSRFFPEMVEAFRRAGVPRFVLDGELVIEIGAENSFDALQSDCTPLRAASENCPRRLPQPPSCSTYWLHPMIRAFLKSPCPNGVLS
jgi:ATP-dependent DNA ligase